MNKTVLVCGLGSMGKRRIRILKSLYPDISVVGVDSRQDRMTEVKTRFKIKVQTDFYKAFQEITPQVVFVCTPPLSHDQFVLYSLENKAHTFSEINLTYNAYDAIIKSSKQNQRIAFLSSTSLYKKEMNWIAGQLNSNQGRASYRYHVGQYLPDWHPWEHFSKFFVAQKESNACREIMAIEFPWIINAFGKVKDLKVIKSNISELDLEYPDIFHLLFKHENGCVGTITIDCICVKAVRKLDIYSDQFYIKWNGKPDTLKIDSDKKGKAISVPLYDRIQKEANYEAFVIENPYIEEVEHFFNLIEGNQILPILYGYEQDKYILKLIDEIEHSD
ncbi:MAG: Gfo/Idh/MocA family oxidoreductase [Desulfobacula sp.]|uniref:Gfo/Idh/MocA family protein n=1 Tax=Desulfobacula sp. TaxID=2593537 RepID=UPI0025BC6C54|nr:Gfo/Idh/MocA family oxidoreductase [Desulfobacula sp.]MCD4722128.1 Gfo/Idh/MocA family oxidoreductase [Desulfobacula sp.]